MVHYVQSRIYLNAGIEYRQCWSIIYNLIEFDLSSVLLKHSSFLELDLEKMSDIIKDDYLFISHEEEVCTEGTHQNISALYFSILKVETYNDIYISSGPNQLYNHTLFLLSTHHF